jgi:hypothetical protein
MTRPLLFLLMLGSTLPAGAIHAQPPGAARQRPCAAPPKLALSLGSVDSRRVFSLAGRNLRTLETRFALAYRLACRRSLPSTPLPAEPLFLKNAPDANTTSIYRQGDEGEGAALGPMVMEHPFIGHDKQVDIPSVEELRSAIVCSVYNLYPPSGPAEDVLECLVD